ncbi:MAG TPA: hypothetical protein VG326_09155 [Tepidisphaeraceae bacterium]|jgi:Uma2 family endonuclease|nr:hypothetical protein [Tepidisphaeraceae bacterium]
MKRFNPKKHPPPDLAIEIDVTHRSIRKEPVYARLGAPEIWRYDGRRLKVLILSKDVAYREARTSALFNFFPWMNS